MACRLVNSDFEALVRRFRRAVLILIWVLCPASALAQGGPEGPSFSCAEAKTPPEQAICGSDWLAWQDRQIARLLAGLRGKLPAADRAEIAQGQALWLKQRGRCGADHACLEKAMRGRILALAAAAPWSEASGLWRRDEAGATGDALTVHHADGTLALLIRSASAPPSPEISAHTCDLAIDAARKRAETWSWKEADGACVLSARIAPRGLVIDGEDCRGHCGLNATLSGLYERSK